MARRDGSGAAGVTPTRHKRCQRSWNLVRVSKVLKRGNGTDVCAAGCTRTEIPGNRKSEGMPPLMNLSGHKRKNQQTKTWSGLYIDWLNCTATCSVAMLVLKKELFFLWRSTRQSWTSQTTRRDGLVLLLPLNHADVFMQLRINYHIVVGWINKHVHVHITNEHTIRANEHDVSCKFHSWILAIQSVELTCDDLFYKIVTNTLAVSSTVSGR